MKKILLIIIFTLSITTVFAQGNGINMADKLRTDGMIYVVVATITIVFIGLAIYLFMIDRRLRKLENDK